MEKVIVKKDGFYGEYHKWDEAEKKHVYWQEKLDDFKCIYGLKSIVEIEDGVVLKDILSAVRDNPLLEQFIGLYNRCDIKAHNNYALSNEPSEDEEDDTKITRIEIAWHSKLWDKKTDNYLDLWTNCYGVGEKEEDHYAIEYTDSRKLVDLPVKIVSNFDIYLWGDEYEEFKQSPFKAKYDLSLLDFLDAIYEELSFLGSPEDRKDKLEDLIEISDLFDSQIKDGEALPWNETEDGKKIYLSDQVRDFLGIPTNEEDRNEQIEESAKDDDI